jgi:hypothetical protein
MLVVVVAPIKGSNDSIHSLDICNRDCTVEVLVCAFESSFDYVENPYRLIQAFYRTAAIQVNRQSHDLIRREKVIFYIHPLVYHHEISLSRSIIIIIITRSLHITPTGLGCTSNFGCRCRFLVHESRLGPIGLALANCDEFAFQTQDGTNDFVRSQSTFLWSRCKFLVGP